MEKQICAEVLVEVATIKINHSFHYLVPPRLRSSVRVGSRVLVPFNRRQVTGYVIDFAASTGDIPGKFDMKEIDEVIDEGPVFTTGQMELARWMADYYLCSLISALQSIISPRIKGTGAKMVKGLYTVCPGGKPPEFNRRAAKRKAAWLTAAANPGSIRGELAAKAGVSVSVVDKLVAEGLLQARDVERRRDPYPDEDQGKPEVFALTTEQTAALQEIKKYIDRNERRVFLLHGVTSSGKTEVYLRAIDHALGRGKQAIMMVPEISLTPQMVSSFKGRFGDRVAVLHSRLSEGERYDEWRRVASGRADVVLGARSAVFAPMVNPGLIILDEEHEPSYKQEETPRYHARDVALKLAGQFEAVAVLGSATPSIESYCRARGGPYSLLELTKRVEMKPMPGVKVIDMGKELKSGNSGIFSRQLVSAVRDTLDRGEQVILFLNRRGYSTFVVCRECGLVMKCPHCDISLTFHAGGRLRCHYCNYSAPVRGFCPDCNSKFVEYFGTGTQRVEEEVLRLFPGVRVLRMDSDTTSRKGSHGRILKRFREGEADILIGTQMVAKGLDMQRVTLVGVINADITLHMPDFRAAERTFQLVAQVAGRTGRGELGGQVLVQTFSPTHYSVVLASTHDYAGFYRQEMKLRKTLGYPPFTRLARVLFTGRDEEQVRAVAEKWASLLAGDNNEQKQPVGVEILGPSPAPLTRAKDRYRYHIIIKSESGNRLRSVLRPVMGRVEARSGVKAVVDIDPQNLM